MFTVPNPAMKNRHSISAFLVLAALISNLGAADVKVKPIRALMITGGCCHDYENQKAILSEGISKRANVTWTILHEGGTSGDHKVSIYHKKDWAKGYDVVLHNECFGKLTDVPFIENIAKAHKDGTPAVVIHCALHSYRHAKTDEWRKVLGVKSMRHQQKGPVDVVTMKPKHPVMKDFPKPWTTPNGELYEILEVYPGCTPLGLAFGSRTDKDHTCIWVNQYGKGRTFGTSLGHHNETMDNEAYLGLVTRGLLWACEKLGEDGKPKPGYEAKKK
jgi:hypothetical protein